MKNNSPLTGEKCGWAAYYIAADVSGALSLSHASFPADASAWPRNRSVREATLLPAVEKRSFDYSGDGR